MIGSDDTTMGPDATEWDFPNRAYIWDPGARAIIAGADRLEELTGAVPMQRTRDLAPSIGSYAYIWPPAGVILPG